MIGKTTMTMLTLVMAVSAISIGYAAPTLFDEVCNEQANKLDGTVCEDLNNLNDRLIDQESLVETLNGEISNLNVIMTNYDFNIETLNGTISNLNNLLVIQDAQLLTMNTTLNDVTIRINELTALHYPEYVEYVTPPVPEIVPLPDYPETPTLEFVPDMPDIIVVQENDYQIIISVGLTEEIIDERYESYSYYVIEKSTDGVNWEIADDKTASGYTSGNGWFTGENYVEYLVRSYTYNDFGQSNYSLIWSGITTEFKENSDTIRINYVDSTSVIFQWESVDTFTHEPLYWFIERSTNYGAFEVIEAEYDWIDEHFQYYTDTDVTIGNIYSYRVTMVTDFETQTRSGFASVLIPEAGYVNVEPQIVIINEEVPITVSGVFDDLGGTDMTYTITTPMGTDVIKTGTIPLNDDGSFSFEITIDGLWFEVGDYTITLVAGDLTLTSYLSYTR